MTNETAALILGTLIVGGTVVGIATIVADHKRKGALTFRVESYQLGENDFGFTVFSPPPAAVSFVHAERGLPSRDAAEEAGNAYIRDNLREVIG